MKLKYDISMTWPQYVRHQCAFNGVTIQLLGREAHILSTLLMRYPHPTPTQLLIESVYENPDDEPEFPEELIYVTIWSLRKKFGNGFIKQRIRVGYVLNKEMDI